jgi:hypothetical protein
MGFGTDEHLVCLTPATIKDPDGGGMCLGYKYTYHYVLLPAYVTDDGYVVAKGDRYNALTPDMIHELQAFGQAPDPLPSYALDWTTYAWGYSLWLLLALVIGSRIVRRMRTSRAIASDAAAPIAKEPPAVVTDGDRFIQAQLASRLHPGEAITHQAYGVSARVGGGGVLAFISAAKQKGVLAALTGERLFLITTRVGAFSPLLENLGVEEIARADIRAVERSGARSLRVALADGTGRTIIVDGRATQFSNQDAFLRDLPRVVGGAASATAGGAADSAPAGV